MKPCPPPRPRPSRPPTQGSWGVCTRPLVLVLALLTLLGNSRVPAETASVRTQSIELRAGWNAVHPEVQPTPSDPAAVFRGLPIETVACFLPSSVGERYLRQPGDAPWKEEGWRVWHAPQRPDAFASNLRAVLAHRPLLILASAACTWHLTGQVRAHELRWEAGTCTFTGLPVDPDAPPTFRTFFEGSAAHARLRIYRLEDNLWKLIRTPDRDRIRAGEAYWIQTDSASRYQGLLRTDLPAGGIHDLDTVGSGLALTLRNDASTPARIRLETEPGDESLPLVQLIRDRSRRETRRAPLPPTLELPELPPAGTTSVRLEPDRLNLVAGRGTTVLRISDGRGTLLRLPIAARRSDGAVDRQP